jgi:hypothetical protein
MTRIDIDGLRSRFETACDSYYTHAFKVIDQSKGGGEHPAHEALEAEALALYTLATVRRELLDALQQAFDARRP